MAYDAFTIDTNAAIEGGLDLGGGLLGQLRQFKDGPIELVLSEVVIREIHKHLFLQVKKSRDTLGNAVAKAREAELASGEAGEALAAQVAALPEPKVVAGQRLQAFFDANGAKNIPATLAPMEALVKGYFAPSPPFEATGAKKSEFPDAIALLSLEAWAKEKGKTILAVSADKGWQAFAEGSAHIDVEADFAKGLAILQEHAEAAQACVGKWLAAVEGGALPDQANYLECRLTDSLGEWNFEARGDGLFVIEQEGSRLEFQSFTRHEEGGRLDIDIVRMGSNEVVARVSGRMAANASADFSLSVWDGIDKDLVSMGSQNVDKDIEFDAAILLTLQGDLAGDPQGLDLGDAEVVESVEAVDFGEVEMDYGDDGHDDADYEEWFARQQHDTGKADDGAGEPAF